MRTTYQKHKYEIRGFFAHALFVPKNPDCYGFFWQCKRYNKKPRFFWILVFANVNGPIDELRRNEDMSWLDPNNTLDCDKI